MEKNHQTWWSMIYQYHGVPECTLMECYKICPGWSSNRVKESIEAAEELYYICMKMGYLCISIFNKFVHVVEVEPGILVLEVFPKCKHDIVSGIG